MMNLTDIDNELKRYKNLIDGVNYELQHETDLEKIKYAKYRLEALEDAFKLFKETNNITISVYEGE